jgi:hypothetical protein
MQERRPPPKDCRSHSICPNFAGIYEAPLILLLVLSQTHCSYITPSCLHRITSEEIQRNYFFNEHYAILEILWKLTMLIYYDLM